MLYAIYTLVCNIVLHVASLLFFLKPTVLALKVLL